VVLHHQALAVRRIGEVVALGEAEQFAFEVFGHVDGGEGLMLRLLDAAVMLDDLILVEKRGSLQVLLAAQFGLGAEPGDFFEAVLGGRSGFHVIVEIICQNQNV
jgi:hypothetical protein